MEHHGSSNHPGEEDDDDDDDDDDDEDPYEALLSWLTTGGASAPNDNNIPENKVSTARPLPAPKKLPAAAICHCVMPIMRQEGPAVPWTNPTEQVSHSLGVPMAHLFSMDQAPLEAFLAGRSSMAPFFAINDFAKQQQNFQTRNDFYQQQSEKSREQPPSATFAPHGASSANCLEPTGTLPAVGLTSTSRNHDPSINHRHFSVAQLGWHHVDGSHAENAGTQRGFMPYHSSQQSLRPAVFAEPHIPWFQSGPGIPLFAHFTATSPAMNPRSVEPHIENGTHAWPNPVSGTASGMMAQNQIIASTENAFKPPSTMNERTVHSCHETEALSDHLIRRVRGRFPAKLHRLLSKATEDGTTEVISWTQDGKAFKVHNKKRFVATLASKYFRHNTMASFRRQLSAYKFQRIPTDGSYHHPLFRKERPDLVDQMERDPGGFQDYSSDAL